MRVILAHSLVPKLRGYHVEDLNLPDRFRPSTEARVRWLIEGVPDFSEETFLEVQLGTQNGWLTVMSEERDGKQKKRKISVG
jgi:hypothetical protein